MTTDPAAIDLEGLGQRYVAGDPADKAAMVIDLIAAVEALRARVVELVGALEDIAKGMVGNKVSLDQTRETFGSAMWEWSQNRARTALAATPAKALERAKAVDECINICRDFVRRADEAELDSPYTYKWCKTTLAQLDALDKEEKNAPKTI